MEGGASATSIMTFAGNSAIDVDGEDSIRIFEIVGGARRSCARRPALFIANQMVGKCAGGRGGIRTHGGLPPTAVFKTAALNHSATLPADHVIAGRRRLWQASAGSMQRRSYDEATLALESARPSPRRSVAPTRDRFMANMSRSARIIARTTVHQTADGPASGPSKSPRKRRCTAVTLAEKMVPSGTRIDSCPISDTFVPAQGHMGCRIGAGRDTRFARLTRP